MEQPIRQSGSEFVSTVSKFFADIGPEGQWLYWTTVNVIFLTLVLLTLLSLFTGDKLSSIQKGIRILQSKWSFAGLLFVFVLLSKFPTAMIGHLNPDEHLWIACAKTLSLEPRLWLACDTSTSGPLVVLPLVLLKVFNLPIDVGTTRIASSFVFGLLVVFTFRAYAMIFGNLARLLILPMTVAVGLGTLHFDYIPYNGEQMAMCLLAIGLYFLSKIYLSSNHPMPIVALGIVLGLVPFAKLQAVPLALIITLFSFIVIIRNHRKYIWLFILSGVVPCIFFFSWIAIQGDFSHFWKTYILFNIIYAGMATPEGTSIFMKIQFAWNFIFHVPDVFFYIQMGVIICILCFLFMNFRNVQNYKKAIPIVVFSMLYFLGTLYCIAQPFRYFFHYTLFSIPAINLLMGSCIFLFLESRPQLSSGAYQRLIFPCTLVLIAAVYFYQVFNYHPSYFAYAEQRKNNYVYNSEVSNAINKYSLPGDRLAVWGWSGAWYSDTDLLMGSRFADTSGIILPNPYNSYFLDIFLTDLRRNTPKIFLDAVSHPETQYDRQIYGFDKFPELKKYIEENYDFKDDIHGYHVYVRKKGT